MRRIFGRVVIAVLLLVLAVGGALYLYLRQSLPDYDGDATVQGLSGDVDIVRDAHAIPHIFASTRRDGLFGLGYVHAQDRLWQMEFQRRIGHGRLSEVFGTATIPQDRFLRTVGFARAARSAWEHLPEDTKVDINAYVAGINAFIGTHHGRQLPPEFTLLRFEPEPFTGVDVVVWVKMMAWDLSSNYSSELVRHDLIAKLGAARVEELLPPYPADGLSILNDQAHAAPASPHALTPPITTSSSAWPLLEGPLRQGHPQVADLLLGGAHQEAIGSNNWVVDGTLTATGAPMLANDPHLAAHAPSIWYLAHVSAGDFDIIGATLPGTPAVALGRNKYIAWGATNVAADVQDLYRETLDPTGRFAEFRGQQEPIAVIKETIAVKGQAPVLVDVRITRHGPLISDAINANNAAAVPPSPAAPLEPLAFRWTALDAEDLTIAAYMRMNEARSWADVTTALKDYVTPSQNFVFATTDGHIGYYAPGRIPIRAAGHGLQPADGSSGDAEWTGYVPFEQLPHTYDPPSHMIVTANNRPSAAADAPMIGSDYPNPYRAQRITDLLSEVAAARKLTPNDFARIQGDTVSLHARDLLPRLLAHVRPTSTVDRQAVDMLRNWDDDMRGDSAAAAIYEAWFLRLAPSIVGDELGPLTASYEGRFSGVTRFIEASLDTNSPWCDNVTSPARESCDDAVTTALHTAVEQLSERMGRELPRWRWDAVHSAIFPHQGLDSVRVFRPFISRSIPSAGDWSTVNVGAVAADAPFEQHSVPSYRGIFDLSPANDSRIVDAMGSSGHFLSRHYDDYLPDWRAVRAFPATMDRLTVEKNSIGRLRLRAK
ncbi:MAG: penicillin acylase family protein [Acidobacteria bacterium]|nr:penicillin acylase family protein [Acidobacteriota bacterium]